MFMGSGRAEWVSERMRTRVLMPELVVVALAVVIFKTDSLSDCSSLESAEPCCCYLLNAAT